MSNHRPTRESMSLEEAKRKGLCTKQDLYDIIAEFRCKNPRAKAEAGANSMAMARPIPGSLSDERPRNGRHGCTSAMADD